MRPDHPAPPPAPSAASPGPSCFSLGCEPRPKQDNICKWKSLESTEERMERK